MATAVESSRTLTWQRIYSDLLRSPHGKLDEYLPVGLKAVEEDAEFLAHLIAWNHAKGEIRDSKVALPLISLVGKQEAYRENAKAALCHLSPRDLLRGLEWARKAKLPGAWQRRDVVRDYLKAKEKNRAGWERAALQHRKTMKGLYASFRVKPAAFADAILFKGERPEGSVFDVLAKLPIMDPIEAAGVIFERRIPFLMAVSQLGKKLENETAVLALIRHMSPAELLNNAKFLKNHGLDKSPALKSAYEEGLAKAQTSKRVGTLKADRAAAVLGSSIASQLGAFQEKKLDSAAIKGRWLILADKSGSMAQAIDVATEVASLLARLAGDEVWLVFFDTDPRRFDVTGKTLAEIKQMTASIVAGGGTNTSCGLQMAMEARKEFDGIALVSDGEHVSGRTLEYVYEAYCQSIGKEATIYHFDVAGGVNNTKFPAIQRFDLRSGVDYYSLPNLIATMRTNRFSLVQEIFDTPLLSLERALKN